jgi:hypothetical protein
MTCFRPIRALCACALLLSLSGCGAIYNWFNGLGEHMPVIGERCENWQCFTESGRARSDMIRQAKEHQAETRRQVPVENPQPPAAAAPVPVKPATPPQPKKLTPYDTVTPDNLEPLPAPGE